jgi:hypothetical protein
MICLAAIGHGSGGRAVKPLCANLTLSVSGAKLSCDLRKYVECGLNSLRRDRYRSQHRSLRLVSIGHGRVNDRRVGLSTKMISTGDEITSLGTFQVPLVLWCRQQGVTRQATSCESGHGEKGRGQYKRDSVCTSLLSTPLFPLESPPITTSRYSYISSSLLRLHAQTPDHRRSIACARTRPASWAD